MCIRDSDQPEKEQETERRQEEYVTAQDSFLGERSKVAIAVKAALAKMLYQQQSYVHDLSLIHISEPTRPY